MTTDSDDDKLIETIARILCTFEGGNPDDNLGSLQAPRWALYENHAKVLIQNVNAKGYSFVN